MTRGQTPAASTTRRAQGLTSGDFFASIGAFIENPFLNAPFYRTPTRLIHKKLWTNLIRPQFIVAKQRSANPPNFRGRIINDQR
jgi:hypothetical protein